MSNTTQLEVSPLVTYNSLVDPHLGSYFSNKRKQKLLRKAGLIRKNGEVVSERMYKTMVAQREQNKRLNDEFDWAILSKKYEVENNQRELLSKAVIDLAKTQKLLEIKNGEAGRRREEHRRDWVNSSSRFECLTPPVADHLWKVRPISAPIFNGRLRLQTRCRHNVPQSKIQLHSRPSSVTTIHSRGRLDIEHIPDDDELFAEILDELSQSRSRPGSSPPSRRRQSKPDPSPPSRSSHVGHGPLDTSPYNWPLISSDLLIPTPPKLSGHRRRASQGSGQSPRRSRPQSRQSWKEDFPTEEELGVRIKMHYYGNQLNLDRERSDPRDEVIIEQQHCGGNTLVVFKDLINVGDEFMFTSYRHRTFPFGLTIYVNGHKDCRVSSCCEYVHRHSGRFGGRGGHFGIQDIHGGAPCYRCRMKYYRRNHSPSRKTPATKVVVQPTYIQPSKTKPLATRKTNDNPEGNTLYIPVERDREPRALSAGSTQERDRKNSIQPIGQSDDGESVDFNNDNYLKISVENVEEDVAKSPKSTDNKAEKADESSSQTSSYSSDAESYSD